jgi:hypothetical protein
LNQLKTNPPLKSVNNDQLHRTILTLGELRDHMVEYVTRIHQDMDANKPEIQLYNEALMQLNLLNANKRTSNQEDCVSLLASVLQKASATVANGSATHGTKSVDDSAESSEAEPASAVPGNERNGEYRKKFPFKQTYD